MSPVRPIRGRAGAAYVDKGVPVAVGGRQVGGAPAALMHTELAFDDKRWFARFGGKYTAQRFYTFTNDGRVSPYTVWDLGGGMRHGGLTFQLNVNNLFNKRYFSTIGTNQFAASDSHGLFATMPTGAPRTLFIPVSGHPPYPRRSRTL